MEEQMKNGFDNPFIQLLNRVGELMIANFLFLVCSIPVVTIGAAAAAMNKVVQNIVLDTDAGVLKTFFRAFRENFKQATILWVAEAVIALALVCYWLIIATFCQGTLAAVLSGLLFVIAILLLAIGVYVTPLMVRYENPLRQHLKNAVLLGIIKLPRTVGMVLLALIGPFILYLSVPLFIQTLFFWLMLGFAFVAYMTTLLLKPVFKELEENPETIGVMN